MNEREKRQRAIRKAKGEAARMDHVADTDGNRDWAKHARSDARVCQEFADELVRAVLRGKK